MYQRNKIWDNTSKEFYENIQVKQQIPREANKILTTQQIVHASVKVLYDIKLDSFKRYIN